MNVVIYARFSSSSQREESIEGQVQACQAYAEQNNYTVLDVYIDRAQSGTNDNRTSFQQMLADSDKGQFEGVLVYQLDRFARNRYDSAINKGKLKKNGVRVISAKENISDDPSGVMLEGILETLAEYYSVDLSQKIRRGHKVNAQKCIYNGGYSIPLGYRVDEGRHFQIDEETAPIARKIFEDYASGRSIKEITDELNAAGLKTYKGTQYGKSSLQRMLKNRRYLGIYIYSDTEIEGGMPQLIDDKTFDAVQKRITSKKHGRTTKGEFLLTTKLFCGHCGSMMVGDSGTSKTGTIHYYYACKNTKRKACDKKSVRQQPMEDLVLAECRKMLTDENIADIAKRLVKLTESETNNGYIKQLKKEAIQTEEALENLMKAIELGEEVDLFIERIKRKRQELEELERCIALEEISQTVFTESGVKFFLTDLRNGDVEDKKYKQMLINAFVNKVYVYDDKTTIHFNAGGQPVEVTTELQEEALNKGVRIKNASSTKSVPSEPYIAIRVDLP